MERRRVLVVEDEPVINDAVADRLRAEGFHVDQAYDGPGAVSKAAEVDPDLVVLDVMLPGFDGHEVCRRIQAAKPVPVLMLTARDDEADVLVGLAVGADDYLTKPFRMRELVARVRALLRRVDRAAELAARPSARLVVGDLVVDTGTRRVTVAEEEVRLTPTEFDLLTRLATTPGEVLTREHLLAEVWDWPDASGTRTVDSHVRALRAKVGPEPGAHRPRGRLRAGGPGRAGGRGVSSPLQPLTSIKVKLGLLVTASVLVAALVGALASSAAVPVLLAVPVTVALALAVTQLLAVGMTSPLREMTEAARRMARGDYRGRVRADSSDEIGELARAFNQMAAELATVDREQRDLVATVSHELRTPLAALTATLENLADGVRPADPEHLGRAVGQAAADRRPGRRPARALPRGGRRGAAAARLDRRSARWWTRWWPTWSRPAGRCASTSRSPTRSMVYADRDPAAPAAHQRARQRGPAQPRGRPGDDPLRRDRGPWRLDVDRRGPGVAARGPGACLRAVRHPHLDRRGHRRHRARPGHRPLGGRRCTAARSGSSDPPPGTVRRAAPRRPATRPATPPAVRRPPPEPGTTHESHARQLAAPAASARLPAAPPASAVTASAGP